MRLAIKIKRNLEDKSSYKLLIESLGGWKPDSKHMKVSLLCMSAELIVSLRHFYDKKITRAKDKSLELRWYRANKRP